VHWTGVLDRDGVQRMDDRPRYWFAAKRYRWGWRVPLTWEGCLVDAIWFIAFIGISPYVQERQHPFKSLGLVFGLLAFFLAINRWKGEPQRWDY
jgi:hypothetical protein